MANIYSPNIVPVANDLFAHQWQQVRAQLEAGWLLKHSSDGVNGSKATLSTGSNPADPMNCRWGVPAALQSGSSAAIGLQNGKDFLITGLSGMITASNTNRGGSEGNILVLSGANSPGNNVSWMISAVSSSTSVWARPLVPTAVAAFNSAPAMSIAGHLARTRTFNMRVEVVTGGTLVLGTSGTIIIRVSLDGGSTYSSNITVTGLAGGFAEIVDASGVATGIYLSFSAGSYTSSPLHYWTSTSAVSNDSNGGSIGWTERSWLSTPYVSMSNGAWIALEGPCTLRIPFTSAPSGTFFRGETITQPSSNAQGELMGVTFEPTTGTGFLVVSPRLQGTLSGSEGWGSGGITGSWSGATVSGSALPTRLVREMVWWRGTTLKEGTWYYEPVIDSTENSSRFGFLSLQAGCTNVIAPGGGGTNNAFPSTRGIAIIGSGSGATHHSQAWGGTTYALTNTIGRMQLFTANCIDTVSSSADGSFVSVIGQPNLGHSSAGGLPIFMRLINGEEGDLEPYAAWAPLSQGSTRAQGVNTGAMNNAEFWATGGPWIANTTANMFGHWASWRRRGYAAGDAFTPLVTIFPVQNQNNYVPVYATNNTSPERVGSTGALVRPLVLQPIELVGVTANARCRKGTLKWIYLYTGAPTAFVTYGNRIWIQCNPGSASSLAGLTAFIPYDGSSTPIVYG